MKVERAVVDTNVLISATLSRSGTPARLYQTLRQARATLLFCQQTQDELQSRLLQRKFDRYVSVALRQQFIAQLDAVTEWISITGTAMGRRDPDDDKLLETAWMGEADCLVTGDRDLLTMHPFRGIRILSPTVCLAEWTAID